MVLKRISENTGRAAGGFLGGIANNPGIIIVAVALGALFFFRSDIRKAFEGLGNISLPQLPSVSFPEITFPSIDIISSPIFEAGKAAGDIVFEAGQQAGQAVFDAGKEFGDFVGSTQALIDQQLTNFFKVQQSNFDIFASNLTKDVQEALGNLGDTGQKAAEEGGPLSGLFDLFTGLFPGQEQNDLPFQGPSIDPTTGFSILPLDPDRPLDLFSFAKMFDIQPQQAFNIEKQFGGLDFQAIAAIPTFGEVLAENPELTASQIANLKFIQAGGGGTFDFGTNTGMSLELAGASFGSDVFLDKDKPGFDLLLEAQNIASMESLGGFVGGNLFGNPDFPITLGEAFLGEQGTVVSPSITNLNPMQLKEFIEAFG